MALLRFDCFSETIFHEMTVILNWIGKISDFLLVMRKIALGKDDIILFRGDRKLT